MQVGPQRHKRQEVPGRSAARIDGTDQCCDPSHHHRERENMRARQNVRRRQRERAEHGNKCGVELPLTQQKSG
ncbi:MAG: hypothetical protein WCD64_26415 [Pseudolabrys sp.]